MKGILVTIIAVAVFGISIVLMPWSELGFSGHFPNWLAWAMKPLGVAQAFDSMTGSHFKDFLVEKGAKGNLGDYAYALFIGTAMSLAAIGIVLVGKEDAEEKTILPVKK